MKILMRTDGSNDWQVAESVEAKGEVELQRLLIQSPSLIPIDEIREGAEPLVAATGEFWLRGSGYTDVLAFSPRGDIAVVECKLAANPESKRKVLGQILEYAAHLWEMDYEGINERILGRTGKNLSQLVEEAIGAEWDEEEFRRRVSESSTSGEFILIIVVDEINEELRRTIRYVNECSEAGFSLHALELRRFKAVGVEVLVPHLYGVSDKPPTSPPWTVERFFEALNEKLEPGVVSTARNLYDWSQNTAHRVSFGTGKATGSFTFYYHKEGQTVSVFSVYTSGSLMLNYITLSSKLHAEIVEEFHRRIHQIPTFSHIPADFNRWPSTKLADAFPDDESVQHFKQAVEWLGENILRS